MEKYLDSCFKAGHRDIRKRKRILSLRWLREIPVRKNGYLGGTCNDSSTFVVPARTSDLHLQYRYKTTHLQNDRLTQAVCRVSLA